MDMLEFADDLRATVATEDEQLLSLLRLLEAIGHRGPNEQKFARAIGQLEALIERERGKLGAPPENANDREVARLTTLERLRTRLRDAASAYLGIEDSDLENWRQRYTGQMEAVYAEELASTKDA